MTTILPAQMTAPVAPPTEPGGAAPPADVPFAAALAALMTTGTPKAAPSPADASPSGPTDSDETSEPGQPETTTVVLPDVSMAALTPIQSPLFAPEATGPASHDPQASNPAPADAAANTTPGADLAPASGVTPLPTVVQPASSATPAEHRSPVHPPTASTTPAIPDITLDPAFVPAGGPDTDAAPGSPAISGPLSPRPVEASPQPHHLAAAQQESVTTTEVAAHPTSTTAAPSHPSRVEPSSLARVEAALDHLELAPPPRTLVIDVGDQGGLRIRMSATGNGLQLDVTTDDGSSAAAWEQDLREHLAQRGFDLGGERSPRNAVEEQDEMTDNPRRPRPDGAIRL